MISFKQFGKSKIEKIDRKIIRLTRTVSGGWPQFIPLTNTNRADSILTLARVAYLAYSPVLQIESNFEDTTL